MIREIHTCNVHKLEVLIRKCVNVLTYINAENKYVTYLSQRDPLTPDRKYRIRLSGSLTRLISTTLSSNTHLSPVPNIHMRMDTGGWSKPGVSHKGSCGNL